jgi:hypothetical protein
MIPVLPAVFLRRLSTPEQPVDLLQRRQSANEPNRRPRHATRTVGKVQLLNHFVTGLKPRIRSDPLSFRSARPVTIPSCGVRSRTQRTCYRVCCISIGAARWQPEKNAGPGGQKIYATQEIAHGVAKDGLIMLIQCVQEPVAQDRGSALSDRRGNEVHGVLLARQRLT